MRPLFLLTLVVAVFFGYETLTENSSLAIEPVSMPNTVIHTPITASPPETSNTIIPEETVEVVAVAPTEPGKPSTPITKQVTTPVESTEQTPQPAPRYTTPLLDFDTLNTTVQHAVVNIYCAPQQGSPISGATGSGVVIDPRGVILTNAHVAQYIVLSHDSGARISCIVRTGAPAKSRYTVDILAFPLSWAQLYAQDIKTEYPSGTGEDDWALLYITGRTDGSKKPETFPYIPFDPRESIILPGDQVLLTGYPAGFLGGSSITRDLWPSSSVITIKNVYTFVSNTLDLLSLGGSVVAQGGSSGGAVVNQWGKLVGIIVTSSVADTTAERDLRAITLSHINNSIHKNFGTTLLDILTDGDFNTRSNIFIENSVPVILQEYNL